MNLSINRLNNSLFNSLIIGNSRRINLVGYSQPNEESIPANNRDDRLFNYSNNIQLLKQYV